MTRDEAIFYIKELQKTYASMDKKVGEAVDMAIEALQDDAIHKPDYSYEADMVRRLKTVMSSEAEDREGCRSMSTSVEQTAHYCNRYAVFCLGANESGECNTTACWNSLWLHETIAMAVKDIIEADRRDASERRSDED